MEEGTTLNDTKGANVGTRQAIYTDRCERYNGRVAAGPAQKSGSCGCKIFPSFLPGGDISMPWIQKNISLPAARRGFHLITQPVVRALPELIQIRTGLLHVFIQHTSASLTINENADADVRTDLEMVMNEIAPEDLAYVHTIEGPDDMPAHVKSSLMGSSVSIPVTDGKLALGVWQGIYLCEHRNHAGPRSLVLTLWGE
jgi:secondary thiamine-phosphate synthase enzyme